MAYEERNPDAALFVRFHTREVEDSEATKKNGYPTFKNQEYCEIRWDNDLSVLDHPLRDEDDFSNECKVRFAAQYNAFKSGQKDAVLGMPLNRFFPNDPAKVKGYEHRGVMTVEQLAALPDTSIQGFMGALEDREKARKYVSAASSTAELQKITAENEQLKAELQRMSEEQKEMNKKFEAFVENHAKEKVRQTGTKELRV